MSDRVTGEACINIWGHASSSISALVGVVCNVMARHQDSSIRFTGVLFLCACLIEHSPHTLLQVETLPEQQCTLVSHLLKLLFEFEMVLDLLLRVAVT